MGNGQLKPAYNLQHGVDSEYITWLMAGPQPTDTTTLIPFLKEAEEHLKFKYKNITADAGYESEENYLFLEANGQAAYIKPANYEISKTRKYRNDIGRIENMEYNPEADIYTCRNSKKLKADHVRHSKSKTGYVSEKTIYKCEDCSGCQYKNDCIKGNNCNTPLEERTKMLQVAKRFLKYRQEDLERILSDGGILFRTNRSIQAEGSFGDLKQDMQFRRYLSKGTANVLADKVLLSSIILEKTDASILLITNDRMLSKDALGINHQSSCRGHRAETCFIADSGKLKPGFNSWHEEEVEEEPEVKIKEVVGYVEVPVSQKDDS